MAVRTGTATLLMTDLANSTALRSTLGEQAADALRREHDRLLTDAVSAHQGRVLGPDFSYLAHDGRWAAAQLCAVTGRPEEAREWFRRATERLTERGAIVLLPYVACDEALMEVRLGGDGDRANGLRRLEEADDWAGRIGLPGQRPRIDELRASLLNA